MRSFFVVNGCGGVQQCVGLASSSCYSTGLCSLRTGQSCHRSSLWSLSFFASVGIGNCWTFVCQTLFKNRTTKKDCGALEQQRWPQTSSVERPDVWGQDEVWVLITGHRENDSFSRKRLFLTFAADRQSGEERNTSDTSNLWVAPSLLCVESPVSKSLLVELENVLRVVHAVRRKRMRSTMSQKSAFDHIDPAHPQEDVDPKEKGHGAPSKRDESSASSSEELGQPRHVQSNCRVFQKLQASVHRRLARPFIEGCTP